MVKNLPAMQEMRVQTLYPENPLEGGNGDPLQCSCLENPRDRGAWWAVVLGSQRGRRDSATKQQKRLVQLFSFSQCRGLKLYVMFINHACYSSTDSVRVAGSFSSLGGPGGSQTVLLIRSPQRVPGEVPWGGVGAGGAAPAAALPQADSSGN